MRVPYGKDVFEPGFVHEDYVPIGLGQHPTRGAYGYDPRAVFESSEFKARWEPYGALFRRRRGFTGAFSARRQGLIKKEAGKNPDPWERAVYNKLVANAPLTPQEAIWYTAQELEREGRRLAKPKAILKRIVKKPKAAALIPGVPGRKADPWAAFMRTPPPGEKLAEKEEGISTKTLLMIGIPLLALPILMMAMRRGN